MPSSAMKMNVASALMFLFVIAWFAILYMALLPHDSSGDSKEAAVEAVVSGYNLNRLHGGIQEVPSVRGGSNSTRAKSDATDRKAMQRHYTGAEAHKLYNARPIKYSHSSTSSNDLIPGHGLQRKREKTKAVIPSAEEWMFIRSIPKYEDELALKSQQQQQSKSSSALHWPPILPDGSIPETDGFDIMPITALKVPRFWLPAEGVDYNTVGSRVAGEETIFLMIASYRDFQCRETIASAFERADHPERLYVGAVDQTVPGDVGCLDFEIPCSQDPTQRACQYLDQISVYHMDAQYATGPVTARHVGDRMYRGEFFVMQMDAHCKFVRHWDSLLIDQWRSTHNEMAVLTSYLSDVQGSFTPEGDSTRNTRPIQCNSDYEGAMPARYLRHGSQPESVPLIRDMPQMQPFWAAGFSFSRGHFKLRVPYDAYQPMVFQGEEIAIGIRGFTFGYDFYAPKDSVVFHEYAVNSNRRKKVHMFWENKGHAGEGQKSLRRATAVIGMAPDIDPDSWDHRELDRYGLGKERELSLFYKIFLINPVERKTVQLCPFVEGGIMHRDFQPFVKPNGLGVDYSLLTDYDTKASLNTRPSVNNPYWSRLLESAITNHDAKMVAEYVALFEKLGLLDQKKALKDRAMLFIDGVNS